MQQGYLTFNKVESVYTIDGMNMLIIPADKNKISKLYRYTDCTNFLLEFSDAVYKKSAVYVKDVQPRFDNSIRCNLIFILKLIDNMKIDSLEIMGDDIDEFFSPSGYFFNLHRQSKLSSKELIYDKEIADVFDFTYNENSIAVSLNYGEILKNGIASDLKLHAKLFVTFPETDDICLVYEIYLTIVRFLHFTRHQKQHNLLPIELFGKIDDKKSCLGFLYDEIYIKGKFNGRSDIEYVYFKKYISNLLQLFADDVNYPIDHLPKEEELSYEYTALRFITIFGAFERECKMIPSLYETSDDSRIKSFKSDLLSKIDEIEKATNEEFDFAYQAKNRISQLWTQSGQKKKIENAYAVLNKALNTSIEHLLWRLKRKNSKADITKLVSIVASILTDLRGKITHGELRTILTDDDVECIRFLDVLTYAQTLKRAHISDEDIELIVGVVFKCNFKFMHFKDK